MKKNTIEKVKEKEKKVFLYVLFLFSRAFNMNL